MLSGPLTRQRIDINRGRRVRAPDGTLDELAAAFSLDRPGPIGYVFYGLYTGIKWLFVWE